MRRRRLPGEEHGRRVGLPARYLVAVVGRRDYGCASELVCEVPDDFRPHPGQFVHVACGGDGRILRRPFSVFDRGEGTASILVREAGEGSSWLKRRGPGDRLDILGPLGRGFDLCAEGGRLLVAGGAGIAPLRFLAKRLLEEGETCLVAWGMGEAAEYGVLPDVLKKEADVRLACLDGSGGHAGSAVDLAMQLDRESAGQVYACGPREMLLSLAARMEEVDREGLARLQVSVEERMACGVGVCRGCAVPVAEPPGAYRAACSDGPVFRGDELDWMRMAALT